ncbi:MAG: hypothetical protein U0791_17495 [Gemmataceae bacterium]
MWEDPIVAEVRATREKLAAQFGYNVKAIFAELRKRQGSLGGKLIRQKKSADPAVEAGPDRHSGSDGSTSTEAA